MAAVARSTNRNRKNRLLALLDRALGRNAPQRRPATPSAKTVQRRARAQTEARSAKRGYDELRRAIQSEGGISPNRDYPSSEIPRELRAKKGRGLAPDEMASVLQVHGLHYGGDVEMMTDIQRRKERSGGARETTKRTKPQTGAREVCWDQKRDSRGRFA